MSSTRTVQTCHDCPCLYQNSEFPDSLCTLAEKNLWGMGYYKGGPPPRECPLRRGAVKLMLASDPPDPKAKDPPPEYPYLEFYLCEPCSYIFSKEIHAPRPHAPCPKCGRSAPVWPER